MAGAGHDEASFHPLDRSESISAVSDLAFRRRSIFSEFDSFGRLDRLDSVLGHHFARQA